MKHNIIFKVTLLTLGFIVALAVLAFAFLSLAFPGVMAGWCEKTGNYSFALKYASLHYKYTGEVDEAARCAEDSILTGKDSYIIEYGTQLVDHGGFDGYCAQQDEYMQQTYGVTYSYRQYIYGKITTSYYAQGNTQSAIGCAVQALDKEFDRSSYTYGGTASYNITTFPANNALIALSVKVLEAQDGSAAVCIAEVMDNITVTDSTENTILTTCKTALAAVTQ